MRPESAVTTDHELDFVLLASIDDIPGLTRGDGERLFNHDVEARPRGQDGLVTMHIVRRRNNDSRNVIAIFVQLLVVGVHPLRSELLFRVIRSLFVHVADGHELGLRGTCNGRKVRDVGNTATTDNSNTKLGHRAQAPLSS